MARVCILMGSPRVDKNTAELLKPFIEELGSKGCEVDYITLADKHILQCMGCYECQFELDSYGCVQIDDVAGIMDVIIESDYVVFATPIYTWYCTAPMKALLDRHYGLNKFYGEERGSLWKGKNIAIITTHGYEAKYAAEPFETGIRRLCEHSGLNYLGMYSVRDEDDLASFQTVEAVEGAREFARRLLQKSDFDGGKD